MNKKPVVTYNSIKTDAKADIAIARYIDVLLNNACDKQQTFKLLCGALFYRASSLIGDNRKDGEMYTIEAMVAMVPGLLKFSAHDILEEVALLAVSDPLDLELLFKILQEPLFGETVFDFGWKVSEVYRVFLAMYYYFSNKMYNFEKVKSMTSYTYSSLNNYFVNTTFDFGK